MESSEVIKIPFGNKKVLYGKRALEYVVSELNTRDLKHAFICTDKSLSRTKMFQEFLGLLENGKIRVTVFNDIQPNPSAESVEMGRRALLSSESDCVIGFGGGSSLDAAKMIAAIAANEGDIIEYTSHYAEMRKFTHKNHYTIGIPTTAGTGSEMDNFACVVDYDGRKQNVFSDVLYYDMAIIDSTLLYTCPPKIIAACGIDAMCHSLEYYIGYPDMIFDVCALKSIDLIVKNLENAYHKVSESSLDQMAMSSFLAGVILTVGGGGKGVPVHSISLPLSMKYHLSHGESLAAVLPYVLDKIIDVLPTPVATVGRYVGIQSENDYDCAKLFCRKLQQLIRALNLEISETIKANEQDIAQLAKTAIISKTTTQNKLLPCDFEKCYEIYRRVFEHETI